MLKSHTVSEIGAMYFYEENGQSMSMEKERICKNIKEYKINNIIICKK